MDFELHGRTCDTVFRLIPRSVAAQTWAAEHPSSYQPNISGDCVSVGDEIVIELRQLPDILGGIRNDGLEVVWMDDPRGVRGIDYDVQIIKQILR